MHGHIDEDGTDGVVLLNLGECDMFFDQPGRCKARQTRETWCVGGGGGGEGHWVVWDDAPHKGKESRYRTEEHYTHLLRDRLCAACAFPTHAVGAPGPVRLARSGIRRARAASQGTYRRAATCAAPLALAKHWQPWRPARCSQRSSDSSEMNQNLSQASFVASPCEECAVKASGHHGRLIKRATPSPSTHSDCSRHDTFVFSLHLYIGTRN